MLSLHYKFATFSKENETVFKKIGGNQLQRHSQSQRRLGFPPSWLQ